MIKRRALDAHLVRADRPRRLLRRCFEAWWGSVASLDPGLGNYVSVPQPPGEGGGAYVHVGGIYMALRCLRWWSGATEYPFHVPPRLVVITS
jgi:hypothetical protein